MKRIFGTLGILLFVFVLVGCSLIQGSPKETAEPEEKEVTREVTKVVIVTPLPPTEMPVGTPTDVPTEVPTVTPTMTPTATMSDFEKMATLVVQVIDQRLGTPAPSISGTESLTLTSGLTETGSLTETLSLTGTMPVTVTTVGSWKVSYFQGATEQMQEWEFKDLSPLFWTVFPNVTLTDTKTGKVFLASDGVEYGEDLDTFCQQGTICDFVVAAQHYRLYTGDRNGVFGKCLGEENTGCALIVFNIGNRTAVFRNQMFDTGFTVAGRYWNGDKLDGDGAFWRLASHVVFNMLNLSTDETNMGANCGNPGGCKKVRMTIVVVSGSETVLVAENTYSR